MGIAVAARPYKRYGNTLQPAATKEGSASYTCYAIGYCYASQTSAIVECITSYACSARYSHFLKGRRNITAIIRIT